MVQALANWLLSLAHDQRDNLGRIGLLKVYSDRTKVRGLCSIAFDRLVEHCGCTSEEMKKAIGSLSPKAGTGNSVHVIITTDLRRKNDERERRTNVLNARDRQREQVFAYLLAADKVVSYNLPSFIPPSAEDMEVTVN